MNRDRGWSTIATRVENPRDGKDRAEVWGVCLHTTGSGLAAWGRDHDMPPIDAAVSWYTNPDHYAPHYVIGHDGEIFQVANDFERMPHIGLTTEQRTRYLSGSWVKQVPPAVLKRWRSEWPSHSSPAHLYPSEFPNTCYVGVEMIPTTGTGVKPWTGLRFTMEQHLAAAAIAKDVATRHEFPGAWWTTPRLVGHEDVQLVERHDARGGWDPGWLRDRAYFSMAFVRAQAGRAWERVA